jgi:flagellar biosynthetic protein FliR
MLQVTDTQLLAWITAWLWPFCRIAALFGTAPIFQHRSIPMPVKIGLAALIAALVSSNIAAPSPVAILSLDGLLMLAQQVIIGSALGLTIRLVFAAIELTGNVVGLQMGLGFALFFDPEHSAQTPVVGSLLNYLSILLFLGINGHLLMIAAVTESFHTFPLTDGSSIALGWHAIVLQGSAIFSIGLHIALPVLATLLLTNVALGILTRAAPQLNLFSVGFPLTLLVGLASLALALPYMQPLMERYLLEAVQGLGH